MKEYNIESTKNKKTKALEVALEGHLNVANIAAIKKELTSTIKNSKNIVIKVANTDDADITLVQLLMALKNKCSNAGAHLDIIYDLNNETSELFSRAGFANTIN